MYGIFIGLMIAAGLFVGMIVLLEMGRRLGQRRQAREEQQEARAGLGEVEAAVFALLGLLVAFTFSGAASRFDSHRELVLKEANAIGTAWLRLDLLPATARGDLQLLFRQYLDARLAVYQQLPDLAAAQKQLIRANDLQGKIWSQATAACLATPDPLRSQLIPALNDMFDIASTRTMASQMHPPSIIFVMLGLLALMSSLLAGYAMAGGKARSWIHIVGFAFIMSITVYVVLDMEYPRLGMIRVDAADQLLLDLRRTMQ